MILLNLDISGSMDKQEPVANVEQKIDLSEKPKEQVITHYCITVFLSFFYTLFIYSVCRLYQPSISACCQ